MTLKNTDETDFEAAKLQTYSATVSSNPIPALHLDTSVASSLNADSRLFSPTFSLQTSPSLDALNEDKNQSLYLSPISARNSPRQGNENKKLIRSNSYTIEKPSPLLLQYIQADGSLSPKRPPPKNGFASNFATPLSTPLGTKSKSVRKADPKVSSVKSSGKSSVESKSARSAVRSDQKEKEIKTKSAIIKTKDVSSKKLASKEDILRSIYGAASPSSRVPSKLKKTPESKSESTASLPKSRPKSVAAAGDATPANEFQRILKVIEEQHSAQMQTLMQRQVEEQRRMRDEFAHQQENLLRQIAQLTLKRDSAADLDENRNCAECCESTDCDDAFLSTSRDYNGNQEHATPNSLKCQRRLVYYDDNQSVSDDLSRRKQPLCQSPTERELHAATVITAHAKGYLTRRLFRTARVQNVVKTIRDTLLFILDIHYENSAADNDSPADLKLKTHLIQQVCIPAICSSLRFSFHSFSALSLASSHRPALLCTAFSSITRSRRKWILLPRTGNGSSPS